MKVEVTHTSACKKEVNVEVPVERVIQSFNQAYAQFARDAAVPGFRPGKAPLNMIRLRYGKEVREQVMRTLVPQAMYTAIEEHNLRVVGEPAVNDLALNDGLPMRLRFQVEVLPEFELGDFRGLKAVKRVSAVTDEMVEAAVNSFRESQASLVPVEDERPAQDDDFTEITLTGYILPDDATTPAENAEPDIPEHVEECVIGKSPTLPAFSDALRGLKVNETREFEISFPEGAVAPQYAGKRIFCRVTLKGLRVKELPELDDAFAQGLAGGFESLADLRQKLREQYERESDQRAQEQANGDLLDQLVERTGVDVPDVLVAHRVNERLKMVAMNLYEQGVDPRSANLDWQAMGESLKDAARRELRQSLILEKIGEQESVDASPEEIQAEIAEMARRSGESLDSFQARLTKDDGVNTILQILRNKKALQLLQDASLIEVEVVAAEPPPSAESQAQSQSL